MTPGSEKREIITANVAFAGRFQAFVELRSAETDPVSQERDFIQLFSLALAKILFLMGENKQAPMLLQYLQNVMGDTVTPKGLNRPTILGPGQALLGESPEKPERLMTLKLFQEEEARTVELALPLGDEGHYYPAMVIFFLQYLVRTLSEASLFFLMLVLGGMEEYYEEVGKTDDLKSLSQAPAHAFSTAVKYIEGERKRSAENSVNPQEDLN